MEGVNSMKYYKNDNGEVYAYESEQERNEWGAPELVEMTLEEVEAHLNPAPIPLTKDQVEAMRLQAYANPYTGSDRFQIEAAAERLSGNEEAAKTAEQKWLERRAEIASEFPWPKVE